MTLRPAAADGIGMVMQRLESRPTRAASRGRKTTVSDRHQTYLTVSIPCKTASVKVRVAVRLGSLSGTTTSAEVSIRDLGNNVHGKNGHGKNAHGKNVH